MAKVREPQKPEHSQSESGEEEESSEESESEPEPAQFLKKVSTPVKATQQKQNKESSKGIVLKKAQSLYKESESGSESESDSDSDRQTLQKSMSGPKKPRSDVHATSAKRPASAAEARDAKKKKVDRPVKADPKPPLFQRVWSEEDEIAILKGMIEYSNIQKKDPVADTGSFYDFIKDDLHVVGVTRTQLQDKIRRLKKKYENNKSRGIKTFSRGHEQKAYQLSKLIWGLDDLNDQDGGENAKAKATDEDEEAKDVSCKSQKWGFGMSVEDRIFRAGEVFFGGNNGDEAEEEWRKLKVDEVELYVKQLEVKLHQSRLVLSFLKS